MEPSKTFRHELSELQENKLVEERRHQPSAEPEPRPSRSPWLPHGGSRRTSGTGRRTPPQTPAVKLHHSSPAKGREENIITPYRLSA